MALQVEHLLEAMRVELGNLTQRAVIAEAQVKLLQQQLNDTKQGQPEPATEESDNE